ncbi:MAG TPA: phosphoribosylformylglycinamidine cyclo-ligase [Patescibacteria group bacterium]|nr:phosphoribosylformylglycinamidine cyclo-ligase [Patescibacteria group bacterium]
MTQVQKTTYKDAGVDIERGDAFVERIKSKVRSTYGSRVVSGVGGFAALYEITDDKLLATGTDGCGTKVKLAQGLNKHDTIGIDLVAMCVNDIICTGATPLFFLDYLATGKLDLNAAEEIITGVVEGCRQSECALIGGETAEMPGVYGPGEYDLAGFAVGEVLKKDLKDGRDVAIGDTLVALPSSGVHSNGYSLVRKLVKETERDLLAQALTPTRIYWNVVKEVRPLVKAMAHITGGGLENIPRMNDKFDYAVDFLPSLDDIPPVFAELVKRSGLDGADLYRTFNMGIGFVFATAEPDKLAAKLKEMGESFWIIGKVIAGNGMTVVKTGTLDFRC